MKNTIFFLKSYIKMPVIIGSLIVLAFVSFFSFATKEFKNDLPCAIFSADMSEEAQNVAAYLQKKGYKLCGSSDEVIEMIENGSADCGVVIKEGFKDKILNYDLSKCAEFIVSDRTVNASLYRLMSAAAIYRTYLPYKSLETMQSFGYEASYSDIERYAKAVSSNMNMLEFEIVNVDGAVIDTGDNNNLPIGVLSIAVFSMFGFLCTGFLRRTARSVRIRFQNGRDFFLKCVVPQSGAVGILTFIASAAGLFTASRFYTVSIFKLLVALAIYVFILVWLLSFISILPISDYALLCIIALDAAISLILCPLYDGTSLLVSYIKPLRYISAPYILFPLFGAL